MDFEIKNITSTPRNRIVSVLCAVSLTVAPVLAQANESVANNEWKFAIAPYVWGADISGKTQAGSPVDVSFDQLVDNLEMAFMVAAEARKDKWSYLLDIVYLDLATSKTLGPLNINMDLEGLVTHAGVGYNVVDDNQSRLDVIVALRNLDLDLKLTSNTPASGGQSGSNLDLIAGIKGQYNFNKRWYLPYYLDIGTGDSDFTWQVMAGINYRAADWADIALVYRHLEWDFKSANTIDDLSFSGPSLGAIFRF